MELNGFSGDIMSDVIEKSWLEYEYTKDGKEELNNPKESSHYKCMQWEDRIYNYFPSRNNIHGVALT